MRSLLPLPRIALLTLCFSAQLASAQDEPVFQIGQGDETALEQIFGKEWGVRAELRGIGRPSVDFDANGASVSEYRQVATIGVGGPVGRFGRLDFDFSHGFVFSDWENPEQIPGFTKAPYDLVQRIGLRTTYLQGIAKDWVGLAFFDARLAAAEGADLLDGFSWNALVGAGTRVTDDLLLGGGVFAAQRLERDTLIVPGLFLDWTIDEEWRLRFFGPGLELAYRPNPDWTFELSTRWESQRFRLDQSADISSGVVEDLRIPILARATYRPDQNWTLSLEAGFDAYRELRFREEDGRNPIEFDLQTGPVIGFSLEYRF